MHIYDKNIGPGQKLDIIANVSEILSFPGMLHIIFGVITCHLIFLQASQKQNLPVKMMGMTCPS